VLGLSKVLAGTALGFSEGELSFSVLPGTALGFSEGVLGFSVSAGTTLGVSSSVYSTSHDETDETETAKLRRQIKAHTHTNKHTPTHSVVMWKGLKGVFLDWTTIRTTKQEPPLGRLTGCDHPNCLRVKDALQLLSNRSK